MRFPNAYSGAKKIFIAQILNMVAAILAAISALMALGAMGASVSSGAAEGLMAGGAIGLLASVVLPVVALILNLVGLGQAARDERKSFMIALVGALIALVAHLVASLMGAGTLVGGIFTLISDIAEIVSLFYTIDGFMELAGRMNRQDVSGLGSKIMWMVVIVYLISLAIGFIPNEGAASILAVASIILTVAVYFIFLAFLSKAKNMLARR